MIRYIKYENYREKEILELYKSVEWSNYYLRPKLLKSSYENSLTVLAAYDGDELVGVIRTVGDGYSIVYIQDLLVKPKYQRQKIGTNLLKQILEKYSNVYQIILLTDDNDKTKQFYQSIGMINCTDYQCIAFLKINNN